MYCSPRSIPPISTKQNLFCCIRNQAAHGLGSLKDPRLSSTHPCGPEGLGSQEAPEGPEFQGSPSFPSFPFHLGKHRNTKQHESNCLTGGRKLIIEMGS